MSRSSRASSSSSSTARALAFDLDRARRADAAQQRRGAIGRQTTTLRSARDELTQHDMQPARGLGAQRDQLVVAIREQPQHRGVVLAPHRHAAPRGAAPRSRSTGRRSGRSSPTFAEPNSRTRAAKRRRHVDHVLARGEELLRQQVARARRRTRSPTSGRRPRGSAHANSSLHLRAGRVHAAARRAAAPSPSIATAVCDALCGSTPIITIVMPPRARGWTSRRALLMQVSARPLSSHAAAGPRPAGASFESQPDTGGRQLESQPARSPRTLRAHAQRPHRTSIRQLGAALPGGDEPDDIDCGRYLVVLVENIVAACHHAAVAAACEPLARHRLADV